MFEGLLVRPRSTSAKRRGPDINWGKGDQPVWRSESKSKSC